MQAVNTVELLIHPSFHSLVMNPLMEPHYIEEEMRQYWCERAVAIAGSDNSILIEFTAEDMDYFRPQHLELSATNPELFAPAEMLRERERLRIESFKQMLGDRYFLYSGYKMPIHLNWTEELEARGLELAPQIDVNAYGEYLYGCVRRWSGDFVIEMMELCIVVNEKLLEEISLRGGESSPQMKEINEAQDYFKSNLM